MLIVLLLGPVSSSQVAMLANGSSSEVRVTSHSADEMLNYRVHCRQLCDTK
jgi:hypothetical protein